METNFIGNKITEARKKANLSQAQLSERLFLSPQAIGKWERGESVPDIITMNRLAVILGVDLNYFSDNFPSAKSENIVNSDAIQSAETTDGKHPELPASSKVNKRKWNMSRANWVDADFSGLNNLHEKFSASNMERCRFVKSNLSGLLLKYNNAEGCDFSSSDISNSRFQASNLENDNFTDSNLRDADFSMSNIKNCDFTRADLTGVRFKLGSFSRNVMKDTVLSGTLITSSSLNDIVFEGTINECSFENNSYTRVTFINTKLTNTFFKGKLKKLKFIDCQADRLTYEFLKSGKANLEGITILETAE